MSPVISAVELKAEGLPDSAGETAKLEISVEFFNGESPVMLINSAGGFQLLGYPINMEKVLCTVHRDLQRLRNSRTYLPLPTNLQAPFSPTTFF